MLDSSPLPLPSQAALRKVMVAETIALARSSGLYDYTSCKNKVSIHAAGVANCSPPTQSCLRSSGGMSVPKAPETMSEPAAAQRVRLSRVRSE